MYDFGLRKKAEKAGGFAGASTSKTAAAGARGTQRGKGPTPSKVHRLARRMFIVGICILF